MSNPNGCKPVLCPHGILGKKKCRECRLAWEREWIKKGNNREKARKATARWSANNPNHHRAYTRRISGILVEHGLAPVGSCPICNDVTTLVPDHDHRTGQLRGWICGRCNRALGTYEAYKPIISLFEDYLNGRLHNAKEASQGCSVPLPDEELGEA